MSCTKRKSYNCTNWNNRLKEISHLLPISEKDRGRSLTKKETLLHMLAYLDFLQSHIESLQSRLPPHCLPEVTQKELLDKKNLKVYKEDPEKNGSVDTMRDGLSVLSADESMWLEENNSLPESSLDQDSHGQGLGRLSDCEELSTSEDKSPGSKDLGSSPSGRAFLLRDPMLGLLPSLGKWQLDSPTLPNTPVLSHRTLLEDGESLNLSPSLFTSPSRGLSHLLLPKGEEELQSLFEDVWLSRDPPVPKVPISHSSSSDELDYAQVSGDWVSSQSEEEEESSDDVNWTLKQQLPLKRARKVHSRRRYKRKTVPNPKIKKKKCVNGFIMFCSINRKLYLRIYPGVRSTEVTKELANLWRIIPKKEKLVYCLKARRVSRQQNRHMRDEGEDDEEEIEDYTPCPLHMLLQHRDMHIASKI